MLYCIWERGLTTVRLIALCAGWLVSLGTAACAMPNFNSEVGPADVWVVSGIVTGMFAIFLWLTLLGPWLEASTARRLLGSVTFPLYLVHNRIGKLLLRDWHPVESAAVSIACSLIVVAGLALAMAWLVELRLVPMMGRSDLVRRAAGDQAKVS